MVSSAISQFSLCTPAILVRNQGGTGNSMSHCMSQDEGEKPKSDWIQRYVLGSAVRIWANTSSQVGCWLSTINQHSIVDASEFWKEQKRQKLASNPQIQKKVVLQLSLKQNRNKSSWWQGHLKSTNMLSICSHLLYVVIKFDRLNSLKASYHLFVETVFWNNICSRWLEWLQKDMR